MQDTKSLFYQVFSSVLCKSKLISQITRQDNAGLLFYLGRFLSKCQNIIFCSEFIVIAVISQVVTSLEIISREVNPDPCHLCLAAELIKPGSILYHGFPCMELLYGLLKVSPIWVSWDSWNK